MGQGMAWGFLEIRAQMHSAPSSHSAHFRQMPPLRNFTAICLKSVPITENFGDFDVTVSPRVVQCTTCTTVSGCPALKME